MITGTLFDEFVVAHTLGWWGKAVILRNYPMLWVLSVGFEFMELTFQHMLPNFNECWWDSWLLDVALCNFIGLLAGMWTVRSGAPTKHMSAVQCMLMRVGRGIPVLHAAEAGKELHLP